MNKKIRKYVISYFAMAAISFLVFVMFRWLDAIEPAFPDRGEALATIVGVCLMAGIFGPLIASFPD